MARKENVENFNQLTIEESIENEKLKIQKKLVGEDFINTAVLNRDQYAESKSLNLMPLQDEWYSQYRSIIQKCCDSVTFFDQFPSGCPSYFDGGVYTFLCNIPVIVPAQRVNGLVKSALFNRTLMASIIKPERYSAIKDLGEDRNSEENNHATPEDLQFWKNNIEAKNPEYFGIKRFCQDRNIITMETLYIDEILSKIKQLMVYQESR